MVYLIILESDHSGFCKFLADFMKTKLRTLQDSRKFGMFQTLDQTALFSIDEPLVVISTVCACIAYPKTHIFMSRSC